MNYIEWNNIIGQHFLNPNNAGNDVYLYITKADIVELGRRSCGKQGPEVWADFVFAIKQGLPGSTASQVLTDKALFAYEKWKAGIRRIDSVEVEYPLYLLYLALFVLPLTEAHSQFNANNYYDRLNSFLAEYSISSYKIGTSNFRTIDILWQDLSEWANEKKNKEFGGFEVRQFGNRNWIYVGKIFSQCLISPASLKRLNKFFFDVGMLPGATYTDAELQKKLLKDGAQTLGLNPVVVNILKNGKNELAQSVLEIVKREFGKWTGESNEIILSGNKERVKRNYVSARFFLQMRIDNEDYVEFSYRLYSATEFPIDLKLSNWDIKYETSGWSKTIKSPFVDEFLLQDPFNKWTGRFPDEQIRVFISAGIHQLNNSFWIETDVLSRSHPMLLLCKNEVKSSILEWGQYFYDGDFQEFKADGLPQHYSLFKFINPHKSHAMFHRLTVYTQKKVTLLGGLKINFRTFLKSCLPKIDILNGIGNETVVFQYKNSQEVIPLTKYEDYWVLPNNIQVNRDFYIRLPEESVQYYDQSYQVIAADTDNIFNEKLPKLNRFLTPGEHFDDFIQGNNIRIAYQSGFIADQQPFMSRVLVSTISTNEGQIKENLLLDWLLAIQECSIQDFNTAFETIWNRENSGEECDILNLRNSVLNLMDFLGYIDYDYASNRISTLPPKLILIPTDSSIKSLLIGCRDTDFVQTLTKHCHIGKLSLHLEPSSTNVLTNSIIPESIFFKSNSESDLMQMCADMGIEFDKWYALKLKAFIPSISEYEHFVYNHNYSDSQQDFDWARKVFDPVSLTFIKKDTIDKTYSMVEYSLTPYQKEYGLWVKNKYFSVDKNWGRYLAINHHSEKVSGFDKSASYSKPAIILRNKTQIAIPAHIPLPKTFARLLIHLNGKAPDFKQLNIHPTIKWFNVYDKIPSLFMDNLFREKLNMVIEIINQPL